MAKGLRQGALQLFAFSGVIAGGLGRRPLFQHDRDRFACKFRMSLKEPVEPQEPRGLCRVPVSPAAHQRDMIAHEFAQHAAERFGSAQCGKGLVRHR